MKKLIQRLGLALLATTSSASLAQNKDSVSPTRIAAANVSRSNAASPASSQKLAVPVPEAMVVMIRSSVLALSQANVTNNYSVLSGLGSASFRTANSPERLSQLFQPFRTNNIDMAPIVYVAPQLSQQPVIANGKLRLVGLFPTAPMRVNYDLTYEAEQGQWRLQGISVTLAPAPSASPAR